MKLRNLLGTLTLAIVPGVAASGQLTTTDDPFPETGQQEDAVIFETSTVAGLKGVITQGISRASRSPSYLFFRIQVTQGRVTTDWAIRVEPDPRLLIIGKNCRDCLINEYQSEIIRILQVGMPVVVKGYQSRENGDNRLLAKVGDITIPYPN